MAHPNQMLEALTAQLSMTEEEISNWMNADRDFSEDHRLRERLAEWGYRLVKKGLIRGDGFCGADSLAFLLWGAKDKLSATWLEMRADANKELRNYVVNFLGPREHEKIPGTDLTYGVLHRTDGRNWHDWCQNQRIPNVWIEAPFVAGFANLFLIPVTVVTSSPDQHFLHHYAAGLGVGDPVVLANIENRHFEPAVPVGHMHAESNDEDIEQSSTPASQESGEEKVHDVSAGTSKLQLLLRKCNYTPNFTPANAAPKPQGDSIKKYGRSDSDRRSKHTLLVGEVAAGGKPTVKPRHQTKLLGSDLDSEDAESKRGKPRLEKRPYSGGSDDSALSGPHVRDGTRRNKRAKDNHDVEDESNGGVRDGDASGKELRNQKQQGKHLTYKSSSQDRHRKHRAKHSKSRDGDSLSDSSTEASQPKRRRKRKRSHKHKNKHSQDKRRKQDKSLEQ